MTLHTSDATLKVVAEREMSAHAFATSRLGEIIICGPSLYGT